MCVHGDSTNSSDFFYDPLNYNVTSVQTYLRGTALYDKYLRAAGGVPTYYNNVTVLFQLHYFNIGNTSQTGRANAVASRIVNGSYGWYFPVVIAPIQSPDSIVTGFFKVCETTKSCIAIAPLTMTSSDYICTAPLPTGCVTGRRRFQYSFSVLYDNNHILNSHMSVFRQNGLQNVAILYSQLPYGAQAAQVTSDTVLRLGMVVSLSTSMSAVTWTANQTAAYVTQLQTLGVEAIAIVSTAGDTAAINTAVALLYYMQAIDWLPSAIVFAGGISSAIQAAVPPSLYAHLFYAAQWDWHLKGSAYQAVNTPGVNLELFPATASLASPAVFRDAMLNEYNTSSMPDDILPYAANGQAALNMVQKWIELAGAYDVESLRAASKSVSGASVTGTLQMDPYGRPVVGDPVAYQVLPNGTNIIVAPYSSVSPILPMPQFWERTFVSQFLSSSSSSSSTGQLTISPPASSSESSLSAVTVAAITLGVLLGVAVVVLLLVLRALYFRSQPAHRPQEGKRAATTVIAVGASHA